MHITAFEVVWQGVRPPGEGVGEAVFRGTRSDGDQFIVNPRARNQYEEFSWYLDNIMEYITEI